MRRSTALASAAIAIAGGGLLAPATGAAASASREYVVLYESGASQAAAAKAITAAGGRIVDVNKDIGVATVRSSSPTFTDDVAASKAVESAARNRSIGTAETGRKQKEDAIESDASATAAATVAPPVPGGDPLSGDQWDMALIGATPTGTYATQPGSKAVRVGIIDTGVDGSHPDIAPNFNRALSRNFTTDDPAIDGDCATDLSPAAAGEDVCNDPADVDEDGHGTHVASTVGSPLNGIGMTGVAPGVEIVNLRAGQDSGYFFVPATLKALTYAGDNGIDVVNMSYYVDPWLWNCESNAADNPVEQREQRTVIEATQRALDYAYEHGVTLVSAEGNGSTDLTKATSDETSPDYPDQDASPHPRTFKPGECLNMPTQGRHVINVTSVGKTGRKAYYSDYGNGDADVAAPGGDSREFFGTPQYRQPSNQVLAAYPLQLAQTATYDDDANTATPEVPRIAPDGAPVDPTLVRDCTGGTCSYYQYIQGTSMASPHAAGVAALIVAARGVPDLAHGGVTLSPDTVASVLGASATDTPCPTPATFTYPFDAAGSYTATCEGTAQKNGFFGEGIINAKAATATPVAAPPAATPPAAAPPTVTGSGIKPPKPVAPGLASAFTAGRSGTIIRRLVLKATPGAGLTVTCKGKGCPRGFVDYRVPASGVKDIAPRFRGKRLAPGARITVAVRTPGLKNRRIVVRVRSGLAPSITKAIG